MNPSESRARACKIAESMGWFLGQDENRKPKLFRPTHPARLFDTWLIALTWLMGQRELLPKGEVRQPAAQPVSSRQIVGNQSSGGLAPRRATAADASIPMAAIVPTARRIG
jgi:hypothetical protein